MSLPYESTPPPEEAKPDIPRNGEDEMQVEPEGLDRPLDEYKAPIPDHVQSLMSRMSQGKVYLLEETPAIIHVDAENRIRGDPRIAALADQLDEHDPTEWLNIVTAASASPVRHNALFLKSDLIKHLSTSKIFSWITSLGASIMGIEWLNDSCLHLIFPNAAASLLALSLTSKAGFDPAEGDDPLLERAAHSVPLSLLPQVGLEPEDRQVGKELLASTEGGPKKRGRGTFAESGAREFGQVEDPTEDLDTVAHGFKLAEGVDPHARVTVRFGTENDKQLRKQAKESEWYKRHGRNAGKEKATSSRNLNKYELEMEDTWEGREETNGEGREFAKRIARNRSGPYDRNERRPKRSELDLDEELDRIRDRRKNGEVEDDGRRRGPKGRRPQRGVEDLDKELDDLFAARSTTVDQ